MTEDVSRLRSRMLSVAYQMLGSVADAEDAGAGRRPPLSGDPAAGGRAGRAVRGGVPGGGREGGRGHARRGPPGRRREGVGGRDKVARFLTAGGDRRTVPADPQARYFGAALDGRGLNPGANPRLGPTTIDAWFARKR